MHCDKRQEEKGVVEGGSHITHVIMRGEKGKETERPRRKKELSKIRSNTNCWKMLPSKVYGERDVIGDVSRCRRRKFELVLLKLAHKLETGSLNWSKTSRHYPSSGVASTISAGR
jgi:hypothetical protein